jgi:hypothetical protein
MQLSGFMENRSSRRHPPMEAGTVAFEDIHVAAARLAARKLGHGQKRAADREARRLSRTIRARRAEVKAQLQRIAFIDEAAKLVGDDCFGFHLAMETDTRELGIIHYILSASDNALDASRNLVCAVKRRRFPVGARPTRQPLQPEATGAAMEETKWLKPSD